METPQIFISYSGRDAFEASLLQYALEALLAKDDVRAWTFQRDQARSEKEVANSLKQRVRDSIATVFLVSPETLNDGATQWMELAYSDAFNVDTFVLLHRLDYQELKRNERGVPPLLLSSQCNPAIDWRKIAEDIGRILENRRQDA